MADTCNEIFDDGVTTIRADGQPTYLSRAAPGYGTDEAKWQIMKYFYDGNDFCIKTIYANGDAGFVHIQDNYATLTYTLTGS